MLNIFPSVETFFYFNLFSKGARLTPCLGALECTVRPTSWRAVLLFIKKYLSLRFRYLFIIANIIKATQKSVLLFIKPYLSLRFRYLFIIATFFYFSFFSKSARLTPCLGALECTVRPTSWRAVFFHLKMGAVILPAPIFK